VALSHKGGEEALPPRFPQGIPQSCLGGVEQVDPLAGNGPHKGGMDINGEIGKSFSHPVEYGQAAIWRASEDAT
jgi:hypothetical protein